MEAKKTQAFKYSRAIDTLIHVYKVSSDPYVRTTIKQTLNKLEVPLYVQETKTIQD